ncbi:DNA polymerase III subunit alpha [Bacillus phage BSTP8]|nr:hypothetical protein BSP19_069 [Bacillus phage BSP19]AYJ76155.1 hypothetical protein BSP7_039 [Bacillus phage BSP7]QQO90086.1 DNA polymerase III subunit alpha [Bacillus phage BSTP5]QRI44375.1 DNA polymerase III subunit alpha [Bacillus phage BSTP8]QRI44392.1 hypothetical protein [Bacillus phage BSTP10]QRI44522.1 hypothetical protein [Bacillus phage BSTP12]
MRFYSYDPGKTTGWALFESDNLISAGESESWKDIRMQLDYDEVDFVLIEEFKLYPWKAKNKSWDTFPEIEVIGVIKEYCWYNGINVVKQLPNQKDFFDNKKLERLYGKIPSRHAKDAVRHGLIYLTFGEGKKIGLSKDILRRSIEN